MKTGKDVSTRKKAIGPPSPVEKFSKEDFWQTSIFSRWVMDREEEVAKEKGRRLGGISVGQEVLNSTTPLEKLEHATLQDMFVHKHHKGNYLLCRIVSAPFGYMSATFVVEDTNGWANLMTLYNFPGTCGARGRELDTLFPMYTIMAIREPYLEIQNKKIYDRPIIHVECPSDIVFLEPSDPILENVSWKTGPLEPLKLTHSSAEWKEVGDKHFQSGEYFASVVAYSYALEKQSDLVPLLLNRCLAYIRLQAFPSALSDAKAAMELKGISQVNTIKAFYRAALAEYGEGHYDEAKEWYSKCLERSPNLEKAKSGYQQCVDRMREKAGDFDWKGMVNGLSSMPYEMEIANFLGPVEVAPICGLRKRKGIVAARDIKAGELLVVERPFVAVYEQERDESLPVYDFSKKGNGNDMLYVLYRKLIQKIIMNPHRYRELLDLHRGDSWSSGGSPSTSNRLPRNPIQATFDIDIEKVFEVSNYQSIEFGKENAQNLNPPKFGTSEQTGEAGIYLLSSCFSHSCIPNANRKFFGDIIIIRAVRDIAKDDEISIGYIDVTASYDVRTTALTRWTRHCSCQVCQCDREVGSAKLKERANLCEESAKDNQTMDSLSTIGKKIDETYAPRHRFCCVEASVVYHRLAQTLTAKGMMGRDSTFYYRRAIEAEMDALERLGNQVVDKSLTTWNFPTGSRAKRTLPISTRHTSYDELAPIVYILSIVSLFDTLETPSRAENWMRAALWFQDTCFGGGIQLFRLRFQEILDAKKTLHTILDRIEKEGEPFYLAPKRS
ncbi:SET domain-containing protein [Serendipita vermifera]|nr:SET domain-containing protein [Serendipita vermifera]